MTPKRSLSLPVSLLLMITMSAICSGTEISSKYEVLLQSDIVFAEVDGVKLLVDLHLPQGAENPPLLIVHGEKDKTVYLSQSNRLVASYQDKNLDVQFRIEPGKGHGWKTPSDGERELVLQFLKKQLRSD